MSQLLFQCFCGLTLLLLSCHASASAIDRFGNPAQLKDYDKYGNQQYNPMFDLGSWHGFLLPSEQSALGAFAGPMVITQEYSLYLANTLEKLRITNSENQRVFDFTSAQQRLISTPGKLSQHYEFDHLIVTLELVFVTNRSALVTTTLINKTASELSLTLQWQGQLLSQWSDEKTLAQAQPSWQRNLSATDQGVTIAFSSIRSPWHLMTSDSSSYQIARSQPATTEINQANHSYQSVSSQTLQPNGSSAIYTTHSYWHNAAESKQAKVGIQAILNAPQPYIAQTEQRWQGYLTTGIKKHSA
ncbi:MAG: alpha-glucosidase, partial [Gammaproteobacteria bacterium]|nr:alpha-glucosidase [Gammaproteobacteria bacterium]